MVVLAMVVAGAGDSFSAVHDNLQRFPYHAAASPKIASTTTAHPYPDPQRDL